MSLDDEVRSRGELDRVRYMREQGLHDRSKLSIRQRAELAEVERELQKELDTGYPASRRDRKKANKEAHRERKRKKNRGSKSSEQPSGR